MGTKIDIIATLTPLEMIINNDGLTEGQKLQMLSDIISKVLRQAESRGE